MARQIRAETGQQCGGDDGAGLQQIRTRRCSDPFTADRAAIDAAIEKGELAIRKGQIVRGRDCIGRRRRHICWRGRYGSILLEAGAGEQAADPRRLLLLGDLLLLGVGRRRSRRDRPRVEDRAAEIARKGRAELRNGFGQAGVVAGQVGKSIRRRAIVDAVQLGACNLPSGLQGKEQRSRNGQRQHQTQGNDHLARQARDGRPARPQPHLQPCFSSSRRCRGIRWNFRHDCGLPSVRTILTFFCDSPPSRSSAAANSRSTTM